MQLATKILGVVIVGIIFTAVFVGVTVPVLKRNKYYKTCQTSSDCISGHVCKDGHELGLVCLPSTDLDVCDFTIKCESPTVCHITDNHPYCKCPPNEVLIETVIDNSPERQCRKTCTNTDQCEPTTLCFQQSSSTPLYCEDRDRIADCTGELVKCSEDTECVLEDNITDCYCEAGENTLIKPTDTGSERICGNKDCNAYYDCAGTPRTVCYTDPYSFDSQCVEPGDVESCAYVICSAEYACRDYDNFSCGCLLDEIESGVYCNKLCDNDQLCSDLGLGACNGTSCTISITRS